MRQKKYTFTGQGNLLNGGGGIILSLTCYTIHFWFILDKIRSTDMDNVAIVTLTKQGKIQLDLDLDQDDLKTIF